MEPELSLSTIILFSLFILALSLAVMFFIIRYAVSEGVKKSHGIIIDLLYRMAKKKVEPHELDYAEKQIKDLYKS